MTLPTYVACHQIRCARDVWVQLVGRELHEGVVCYHVTWYDPYEHKLVHDYWPVDGEEYEFR